jgi:Asp-tRNA(Asn)/Glu-tRNA(Gln) amidotransferase A subunit family amidase
MSFDLFETTIEKIHSAYRAGELTCRQLVEMYLEQIEKHDQKGASLNAIITVNPNVFEQADNLDALFRTGGFVGPLHGIPVIVKDQVDVTPMATTLGSILFKDHFPAADAFVIEKLRQAGAVILAKATLAELAAGDTHGSLFGSTRNPYDLERTPGGSSGGSAVSVAANYCAVAIGQEGYASICRPSSWNCVVGMRPTTGLVSRSGAYGGWPLLNGSLGPMARNVKDVAKLLDVMAGFDPDDPATALGRFLENESYADGLHEEGLRGKRIGVIRETIGQSSEPGSNDFLQIDRLFGHALDDLTKAGAVLVDPLIIPSLKDALAKRSSSAEDDSAAFERYMARSKNPAFRTREEVLNSPDFELVAARAKAQWRNKPSSEGHYASLRARESLLISVLHLMSSENLDAIVIKSVEHQPSTIEEGIKPPFINHKGAHHLATFLAFVPSIIVPMGFIDNGTPAGITFLSRPYAEKTILGLAYAFESQTKHRKPPPILSN